MPKVEYWTQRPTAEWAATLRSIKRFHNERMIHRTNLYIHATRVQPLALFIGGQCSQMEYQVDMSTVERRSLHHDDPEVETTDIPSPVKRAMTAEQKEQLRNREMDAATRLASRFTTLPRETYLLDQERGTLKESVEDQIVDIADKLDGLCETLHELRCGNETFWYVLENYRAIFLDLAQYPMYGNLNITVPSKEDVEEMPRVDIGMLSDGREDEFWKSVYDSSLPWFYSLWMDITTNGGLFRTLGKSILLFPGWESELIKAQSAKEARRISDRDIALEEMMLGAI